MLRVALKNVVSRKSSFSIALFIAFAVALLVLFNSLFDSTERGVEGLFRGGFTGDFMIRPASGVAASLFGDETPLVGALTRLDTLAPFGGIAELLASCDEVEAFAPQFSALAYAENPASRARVSVALFAAPAEAYFDVMDELDVVAGAPFADGKRGAILNAQTAARLGLSVGDEAQFVVAGGGSFRIRAAPVAAIVSYSVENATLSRICLVDAETFLSLMDMQSLYLLDEEEESPDYGGEGLFADLGDIDYLFMDSSDVGLTPSGGEGVLSADALLGLMSGGAGASAAEGEGVAAADVSAWHFITGRLKEELSDGAFIRKINRAFRERGWAVEAVNWRHAGGLPSLYLYWLRVIFNAGLLVVLAAGFIVVNNALAVNVISRTKEIGTMRAVGASATWISRLFMAETFMLTLAAGAAGLALGWLFTLALNSAQVSFTNSILVQLFGGSVLQAFVSARNAAQAAALSCVLGVIAWAYPVRIALAASPTAAMQGEE